MFNNVVKAIGGVVDEGLRRVGVLKSTYVVEQYVRAGARFGEMLHHLYMGRSFDIKKSRERWASFERQYAALGFRTISIDDFVEYGAYGVSLDHLRKIRRAADEAAILHAEIFTNRYASGYMPASDVKVLMTDGSSTGSDNLPPLPVDGGPVPDVENLEPPIPPAS